jgi:16S rRNA (uracil1498-N3)-methyltransferase
VLRGQEGRHATTVRRLLPGEQAYLTDGAGTVAQCQVVGARPGELELAVLARWSQPRPQPSLAAAQAIPKGERAELAVELLTEVGADTVLPWQAERCVVRWRGDRAEKAVARWRSTALQAAKQSRRAWFPEVTGPADQDAVARRVAASALAVLLDPDAQRALADLAVPQAGEIVLLVGPEGGVSPSEARLLTEAGAVPARLGPTVLRASTAGAIAAGILLSRTARWDLGGVPRATPG